MVLMEDMESRVFMETEVSKERQALPLTGQNLARKVVYRFIKKIVYWF